MGGIARDLGPKGFAVIEAALNDNADVPGFMRQYNTPFPVGTASGANALEYLQWPPSQRPLVPLMVFVDRAGMIRAQYSGYDTDFFGDAMDKNLREEAEKLLKEGTAGGAKPPAKAPSTKKSVGH